MLAGPARLRGRRPGDDHRSTRCSTPSSTGPGWCADGHRTRHPVDDDRALARPAADQPRPAGRDPGAAVHRPRPQPALRLARPTPRPRCGCARRSPTSSSTPATPRTASAGSARSTTTLHRDERPGAPGPRPGARRASTARRGPAAREALAVEVDQIREGAARLRQHDVPRPPGLRRHHRRRPRAPTTPAGDLRRHRRRRSTAPSPRASTVDVAGRRPGRLRRRRRQPSSTTSPPCPPPCAPATPPAIRAGLDALNGRHGPDHRRTVSDVGARSNRARAGRACAPATPSCRLTNSLSEIENTDLPKAMVDLQMQEVAYQAALAATARVHAAEPAGLSEMIAALTRPTADATTRRVMPEIPVIELVQPMPGFPDHARFALVQLDDDGVLCAPALARATRTCGSWWCSPVAVLPRLRARASTTQAVADLGITSVEDVVVLLRAHRRRLARPAPPPTCWPRSWSTPRPAAPCRSSSTTRPSRSPRRSSPDRRDVGASAPDRGPGR